MEKVYGNSYRDVWKSVCWRMAEDVSYNKCQISFCQLSHTESQYCVDTYILIYTVYTHILAKHETPNLNAEIMGSAYTRITIITL